MNLAAVVAQRHLSRGFSHRFYPSNSLRGFFTNGNSGSGGDDKMNNDSFESPEDFERRIFGEIPGGSSKTDAFFDKLGRTGNAHCGSDSRNSQLMEGLDDSFSLSDGMDGKLEKKAMYFEFDPDEVMQDDFVFRPDINFVPGMTYDTKDLDLTKPGVQKPMPRREFTVTTDEVLRKADFRNVRFLANFLTEAGIIIKRSQTGISAKAQRKIAREIKTARAFGLMPFTTMGTKSFIFGRTMEHLDEDYEYEVYDNTYDADAETRDVL